VWHTLTDSGAVASSTSYDPWGTPTQGRVATWGFTGELQQNDAVYLRARWYQPSSGTLLGRDPFGGDPHRPGGYHPYQYAFHNPVGYTDPTGQWPCWLWCDAPPPQHWTTAEEQDFLQQHADLLPNYSVDELRRMPGYAYHTPAEAARYAAGYRTYVADPQAYALSDAVAGDAGTFSEMYYREALAQAHPATIQAELDALLACQDTWTPEQERRFTDLWLRLNGLSGGNDAPMPTVLTGGVQETASFGAIGAFIGGGQNQGRRLPQDVAVNPVPPPILGPIQNRTVGPDPLQNTELQADIAFALRNNARDVRVDQQQVNANGQRVGINRPDLQYTDSLGQRIYIEYDRIPANGVRHKERILANDPQGVVINKTIP
jgi:RHS repeat-associated protein